MKLPWRKKGRSPKDGAKNRASAPVMRYYQSESSSSPAKRSERIQKQDNAKPAARFSRLIENLPQKLVFIAIVGLLLFNTTLSSAGTQLSDENNVYRTSDMYKAGVDAIFTSSWRNNNKLTFSSTSFEQEIRVQFPEITRAVAVVPIAGRELAVTLEFTKPLVRLVDPKGGTIGVVGERGNFINLDEVDLLSHEDLFAIPTLRLLKSPEFAQGSQLLTSVETELIQTLRNEFDGSSSIRPQVNSILFDVEKREMQVRFNKASYFARVTPERDSREQVGALVATIAQLDEDNDTPNEYIDVRVEGRVFVK